MKYIKQVRKEKVVLCNNYLFGIDLIPSMYRGSFADDSINTETYKGTLWRGKQCVITYELNSYSPKKLVNTKKHSLELFVYFESGFFEA